MPISTIAFGFVLGFIGYLPPGNINLTVVQLALGSTRKHIWYFILFAALMEFFYCVGCLMGLDLLMRQPQLVIVLQWLAVFIFILLGLLSFFHKEDAGTGKVQTFSGYSRGLFAAFINPLQIPFWLVWGVYLNDLLKGGVLITVIFAFVTSCGTALILWLYAVGGKKLVEKMKLERKFLNRVIGIILISLGLLQLLKLLHKQ